MIRHLFKIIWNERKANAWIVVEYVVVFCILWFCVDYLYFMARSYTEPLGYDIDYTYRIQMGQKEPADGENEQELTEDELYNLSLTFLNRLKNHPDVENASLSHGGMPFGFSQWTNSFFIESDSLDITIRMKGVTTGFFDVFRLQTTGSLFNWEDKAAQNQILISSDRYGRFGQYPQAEHHLSDVRTLKARWEEDAPHFQVIGTVNKVKDTFDEPYVSTMFRPLERYQLNLADLQNVIRIKPGKEKGFEERFTREMQSQLNIGPFFLVSVTSLQDLSRKAQEIKATDDKLNGVYAITAFLVVNIFLGLIGTFWYRTQSRRSEVGLRIALGATRGKVKGIMLLETMLLLFVSSLLAVNICVNIGQTDLLEAIGVPLANRVQVGAGIEQEFINYLLTFLFLALISVFAVWYPAKQASDIPPAEALREE